MSVSVGVMWEVFLDIILIHFFHSFFFFSALCSTMVLLLSMLNTGVLYLFFGDICLRNTEVFRTVNVKTLVDRL